MTQNFENHTKFVPGFHIGVLGIFTINLGWSLYRVSHSFSAESVISLLLAIAFILLAFYARTFALAVQDRVIRLEMRLRMQQVLPAELRPRIPEFSVNQLVALRFASDAELPALAKKVLDEKLNDRKAIKKMIREWQPDFLRA
jgi:dolichyl-phosphate-mannose--protein O-mannosyl transferase